MILSKSNYISFLQHPAHLWLRVFDKKKLPPIDEATQDIFDAGNLFESYVEKLYPDAVKVGFEMGNWDGPKNYKSMPKRTQEAFDLSADVILQGRLEANSITCIFDVLKKVKGEESNVYDLIEIKSSSSAKVEHAYDLAFQKLVLEGAGLPIRNCSVIHLNGDYIRDGEIDLEKLTIETDITEEVNALEEITKEQVKEAFNVLDLDSCPDLSLRHVNKLEVTGTKWKDYWLKIFFYLNKDLPPNSIYKLCRLKPEQVAQFEDAGFKDFTDIPEDFEGLHEKQIAQIKTTKTGERIIQKDKIKNFIDSFEYPLYFFDYETMSDVIPRYDGMHPYKDYPFQYSLHILDAPDAELRHTEYLHSENSNPMPKLLQKLKQDIGDKGTVLTWNMSYEKACNDRMAEIYPEYAEFLQDLNERIEDLMTPFFKQWFIDKGFFGSASVKYVLPTLVPELSYKDLSVGDGLTARRMWTKTVLEVGNTWQRDKVLADLRKYCTLDTFAMVKILEVLTKNAKH